MLTAFNVQINILIFYAPEIFLALGTTSTISLVAAIILGACNHLWVADNRSKKCADFLCIQQAPCGFQTEKWYRQS